VGRAGKNFNAYMEAKDNLVGRRKATKGLSGPVGLFFRGVWLSPNPFPNYSGGLGILSGPTTLQIGERSGAALCGDVAALSRHGYFKQHDQQGTAGRRGLELNPEFFRNSRCARCRSQRRAVRWIVSVQIAGRRGWKVKVWQLARGAHHALPPSIPTWADN